MQQQKHIPSEFSPHTVFLNHNDELFLVEEVDSLDQKVTAVKLNHPLTCSQGELLSLVGSCNDFICLAQSKTNHHHQVDDDIIVLMNLSTRNLQLLPSTPRPPIKGYKICYGFGYDAIHHDYKVVRIVQKMDCWDGSRWECEVKVYSLRRNAWKLINTSYNRFLPHTGVFSAGALHWMVRTTVGESCTKSVAFDLTVEEFHDTGMVSYFFSDVNLGVLGGRLCMMHYCRQYKGQFDIFMSEENGSWIQLCFVTTELNEHVRPVVCSKSGRQVVLLGEKGRELFWLDLDNDNKLNNSEIPTVLLSPVCFKCLSKYSLSEIIKDLSFISLRQKQFSVHTDFGNIFLNHKGELLLVEAEDSLDQKVTAVKLNHHLTCSQGDTLSLVGSCNNFICFAKSKTNHHQQVDDDIIVLWNLSTRNLQLLPSTPLPPIKGYEICYGFGYDAIHDDCKVVRIVQKMDCWDGGGWECEVQVYSLRRNAWWTSINTSRNRFLPHTGVFSGGELHWMVRTTVGGSFTKSVAFDLTVEEFHDTGMSTNFYSDVNLGVLGGRLCMMHYCRNYKGQFDIFMLEENGSWIQLCFVTTELNEHVRPVVCSKSGRQVVLLGEKDRELFWLDLDNGNKLHNSEIPTVLLNHVQAEICMDSRYSISE